jgi:hypothetical protein
MSLNVGTARTGPATVYISFSKKIYLSGFAGNRKYAVRPPNPEHPRYRTEGLISIMPLDDQVRFASVYALARHKQPSRVRLEDTDRSFFILRCASVKGQRRLQYRLPCSPTNKMLSLSAKAYACAP